MFFCWQEGFLIQPIQFYHLSHQVDSSGFVLHLLQLVMNVMDSKKRNMNAWAYVGCVAFNRGHTHFTIEPLVHSFGTAELWSLLARIGRIAKNPWYVCCAFQKTFEVKQLIKSTFLVSTAKRINLSIFSYNDFFLYRKMSKQNIDTR